MATEQTFTLKVVKVKGHVKWAVRAIVNGKARYRGCYYKKDALMDIQEWEAYLETPISRDIFCSREFYHNFNSAEELNIKEV